MTTSLGLKVKCRQGGSWGRSAST